MRQRLCKSCHGWHDIESWPRACISVGRDVRSTLPAPIVIGDVMNPVQSMLDGKMYDSKSSLRATYRAAGVREVGNDVPMTPPPKIKPDRAGIKASVAKAFSRAGLGA